MKKRIFYVSFALLAIAVVIAGLYLSNDKSPQPSAQKNAPTSERKYTPEERKQILQSMIERDPELWRERYILGGIYLQEGDFQGASVQFKKVIDIRPVTINAYNALGMCYLNQGRNSEAVAVWKKALKIDPENMSAKDLIARVENAEKETQKRRKLETLLEKNPNRAEGWYSLGKIYLDEKLYDRAIFALKKASELDPGHADYFYRLGYAYHRVQDYNQAEPALKSARALDPGNEKIEPLLRDVQAKKAK
jgi:cytochrome c-type biogenesis protein CcmH/NrfG